MSGTGKPTAQHPYTGLKWLPPETEMASVWRYKFRLVSFAQFASFRLEESVVRCETWPRVHLNRGQFVLAHKPMFDNLIHLLAVIVELLQRSVVAEVFDEDEDSENVTPFSVRREPFQPGVRVLSGRFSRSRHALLGILDLALVDKTHIFRNQHVEIYLLTNFQLDLRLTL
ncbi:hypothetical protein L596_028855 [Steinernema carpocapsae]|uniref:Uncharacterized protein n=1 Tax=Steinernema carpocapsae TaxID=34508 RepID=A0A4U5LZK6_STECR|nr:hypothetical protein L596_028855 [Steinernema carpocapsae]